ncbi:hypothetical protein RRG51_03865 [Mycoplasmopsis cynos]|uniref:Mbov_0399 family ICE element protein n=1 Tax=Mycoplasmopsis cynos TaxID=171284 RepID=UPI002B001198|nr:hypothetical protein [Mycoplasmopsis cynos]WQQ16120.1 hypothetical protein RRG51_03865 [Mycoplasmopsis cynos]
MKKRYKLLIGLAVLGAVSGIGWGIHILRQKEEKANDKKIWVPNAGYINELREIPFGLNTIKNETKSSIVLSNIYLPTQSEAIASNLLYKEEQIGTRNISQTGVGNGRLSPRRIGQIVFSRTHPVNNPSQLETNLFLKRLYNNNDAFKSQLNSLIISELRSGILSTKKNLEIKAISNISFENIEFKEQSSQSTEYNINREKDKKVKTYKTFYVRKSTIRVNVNYDFLDVEDNSAYEYFKQKFLENYNQNKSLDDKLKLPTDYQNDTILATPNEDNVYSGFKTNRQMLNDWFDRTFSTNNYHGYSIRWEVSTNNANAFNLFIENSNNKKQYIFKNIEIKWEPSNKLGNLDITKRLIITPSKYVDFKAQSAENPTGLVIDKPTRLQNDKAIGLESDGKTYYLGTWIYNAPVDVAFKALKKENEILEINNIKIDVLNQNFNYTLYDQRANADDNSLININENKEEEKEEIKKNEYIIKLKTFNNINIDKEVKNSYIYKIIVDSKAQSQDYKWYGWNPDKIRSQKDRITQYLENIDGKKLLDENGNYIPNPKYDPLIDAKTGTKKELVWVDFSQLNFNISEIEFNNVYNQYKNKYQINEADYPKNKMYSYFKTTSLPPLTMNLLHTTKGKITANDKGVIAEASVISKGAIKELLGDTKQYIAYKLNNNDTNKWNAELLDIKTSDYSYFSTPGLYLFTSSANKQISSYKLILIDGRNDESVNNKLFSEIQGELNYINYFWDTTQGIFFLKYITTNYGIDESNVKTLTYEEIVEYWKRYINYLSTITEEIIDINPYFNIDRLQNKYNSFNDFKSHFNNEYLDNKDKIINDFANFKYSDLVSIRNYEFDDDNETLKLIIYVKSADSRFKLTNFELNYKINLATNSANNKITNLFINWNTHNLNNLYSNANDSIGFLETLNNEINKNGFKNIVDNNFYNYLELLNPLEIKDNTILKISVKLKEEYRKNYFLANPEFEYNFQYLDEDFEIFNNFNSQKIKLINETDVDRIKEKIIKNITDQISLYNENLVLNQHYQITNLDDIATRLSKMKIYNDKTYLTPYLIIKAKEPYYSKSKILVPVINLVKYNFTNIIFDKLLLDYNIDNIDKNDELEVLAQMRNEITKYINLKIRDETNKMFYYTTDEDTNLTITNINEEQLKLLFTKNELVIKIAPKIEFNSLAEGESTLIVKNDNPSANRAYDINELEIEDLNLASSKPELIKEEIITYVKNKLSFINDLEYIKDYQILNIDNNDIYNAFISKNANKSLNITIKGSGNKITGLKTFIALKVAKYNLSSYTWNNIDINVDVNELNSYYDKLKTLNEIREVIVKNLNSQITKNLNEYSYLIENNSFVLEPELHNEILELLLYNAEINLNIYGNNLDIEGLFSIKIKNNHPSANKPYPLNKIKIDDLVILQNNNLSDENKINDIKSKIEEHLANNKIIKTLNLNKNDDYKISILAYVNNNFNSTNYDYEDKNNDWLLLSYIYKKPYKNELVKNINNIAISILAKENNTKNLEANSSSKFYIYGKSIEEKNENNNTKLETSARTPGFNKLWLAWIVPLSIVLLGVLIFGGWALYVRFGKKRIK